jgi:hypothetical protein
MTPDEFQRRYASYSTRDGEAAKAEAARVNTEGIDGNSAVAINLGEFGWCLMLLTAAAFAAEIGAIPPQGDE